MANSADGVDDDIINLSIPIASQTADQLEATWLLILGSQACLAEQQTTLDRQCEEQRLCVKAL